MHATASGHPSVLVMSHSHPRLTHGGAEISAHALFRQLRARGVTTWFLACAGPGTEARAGASLTQPYGIDEFIYTPAAQFDYFKFANPDAKFPRALADLIAELRPDIVHAHHYVRFGVEAFAVIKRASPSTRILLSLHEYLAICHHHGQMVKTNGGGLCRQQSAPDCAACFPEFGARDFFLRKRYLDLHFADVDLFVSPSRFLADRYVAWGLPESKVVVMDNVPPDRLSLDIPRAAVPPAAAEAVVGAAAAARPPRARKPAALAAGRPARETRFGFFGQMSPLKGINVLIDAAKLLEQQGVRSVSIDIHGDYSNQPTEFQAAVRRALAEAGPNVRYHGPYANTQVLALMSEVDAVLVPSIWWENSPVVIQEAFAAGRPVICSDIGGMAEKVRPGLDGLHFEAGRPASLARVLAELAASPDRLAEFADTLTRPPDAEAVLRAHFSAYARVMA
jgi:glycosyltransferase involved in cell wall biosynthesis